MPYTQPRCDVAGCKRRGVVIHAESMSLYCRMHARYVIRTTVPSLFYC